MKTAYFEGIKSNMEETFAVNVGIEALEAVIAPPGPAWATNHNETLVHDTATNDNETLMIDLSVEELEQMSSSDKPQRDVAQRYRVISGRT